MAKWDLSLLSSYYIKERVNKAAVSDRSSSDVSDALVTCQVLAASTATTKWIVDSGVTYHMCNDS